MEETLFSAVGQFWPFYKHQEHLQYLRWEILYCPTNEKGNIFYRSQNVSFTDIAVLPNTYFQWDRSHFVRPNVHVLKFMNLSSATFHKAISYFQRF